MNKLFKTNNLPSVVLPDNPPSQEIINTFQKQPSTMGKQWEPQPATSKQPQQQEPNESEEETTDDSEEEENTLSQTEIPTQKPIKGKDIGLQIYAKKSEPFPKKGLDLKGLTTGMLKGKFKWTYTSEERGTPENRPTT